MNYNVDTNEFKNRTLEAVFSLKQRYMIKII